MNKIIRFFDRLEDKIRGRFSRKPILYALVGGIAIVLFWRGVWLTADYFPFLNGPVSVVVSVAILLGIGLFASFFIGDQIIISGLKSEKKLTEKTETEVKSEILTLRELNEKLERILKILESKN